MNSEIIAFTLDAEKRDAIDQIAQTLECDRSDVLNQAIDYYLDVQQWQIQEIKTAIAEANQGDFATDEEVKAVFERLTNEN
ncbi:MAG: CopG family transcriptional regulator [Crocosphaera sp.]|jgi:predicted transcriptional regulator